MHAMAQVVSQQVSIMTRKGSFLTDWVTSSMSEQLYIGHRRRLYIGHRRLQSIAQVQMTASARAFERHRMRTVRPYASYARHFYMSMLHLLITNMLYVNVTLVNN